MKHLILDLGPYTLDVDVPDDVDLDSRFKAKLHGEEGSVMVNGWLIDNAEEVE